MRARHSDGSWHSKTTAFHPPELNRRLAAALFDTIAATHVASKAAELCAPNLSDAGMSLLAGSMGVPCPDATRPVAHVPMHSTYPPFRRLLA
jgi:hypothetical protein